MTSTALHLNNPHNRPYGPHHSYPPFVPKPNGGRYERGSPQNNFSVSDISPPTTPPPQQPQPTMLNLAPKIDPSIFLTPNFDCGGRSLGCRNNEYNSDVKNLLERYHKLVIHETHLVQQLKTCDMSSSALVKTLGMELHTVLNQKMRELKALVGEEGAPPKEVSVPPSQKQIPEKIVLYVEEQPTGNVVANKYLEPPLVVRVDDYLLNLAREGRLQVSASLCLTLTDESLLRTLDNKQDILQGHTIVPVSGEGYATFNKLKIMEVSSKHHHQAFSIQLQLQELSPGPTSGTDLTSSGTLPQVIPLGETTKLAPLHVQSRINKRKRSIFGSHGRPRKRARGESDCNYVDITPLLVLPQKEAATRLGISESMLCKRFKECTRRKWPYRYLRKIDKMIRMLTLNKKNEAIPREDQEKIHRLKREREECLHPVKIRITGHDKTSSRHLLTGNTVTANGISDVTAFGNSGKSRTGVIGSDSESDPSESNSSPYEGEEDGEEEEEEGEEEDDDFQEEDEISQVASTLNLLKKGAF